MIEIGIEVRSSEAWDEMGMGMGMDSSYENWRRIRDTGRHVKM